MSINLFLFLGLLLAVVVFSFYMSWIQDKKEDAWRHEFILLVQAKKPLRITTSFIYHLAAFYVDSGEWETTSPSDAAKIELNKMSRLLEARNYE